MIVKSTETNYLIGEQWLNLNEEVDLADNLAAYALTLAGVILIEKDLPDNKVVSTKPTSKDKDL